MSSKFWVLVILIFPIEHKILLLYKYVNVLHISVSWSKNYPAVTAVYITINQQDAADRMQFLFYCTITLYVSCAFHTHHQEYTKLYHSLRYRSYYSCNSLLPTWPSLNSVTLEEGSCNYNMTCTGGCDTV